MTPTEIIQTIDRLRRDMPRNEVVKALCDACEQMVKDQQAFQSKPPLTRAEIQKNYRDRKRRQKEGKQ